MTEPHARPEGRTPRERLHREPGERQETAHPGGPARRAAAPPSLPPGVAPPYGARNPNRAPQPSAAHGGVLAVSIALAATLIAVGTAAGNTDLIALLMLLLGCGALVVPVAMVVTTWAQARLPARVLLALAGLACVLLLVFAVVHIAAIAAVLV